MRRLAALGLVLHITEMDVRIKEPATEIQLTIQARIYSEMLEVCLSQQACGAFVFWGFTDRYSWIPAFFRGWTAGLIFDAGYQPKPAYHALIALLSRTWRAPPAGFTADCLRSLC